MVTLIGNLIFWPVMFAFTNLMVIRIESIVFFIIAGLLHPGVSRLLYFKGMSTLGLTVNSAIFSTYPIYSVVLGMLLLGEPISLLNWVGVFSVLVGGILIRVYVDRTRKTQNRASRKALIFPVLGALVVACAQVLNKFGLSSNNAPLTGVTFAYFSSLLLIMAVSFLGGATIRSISLRKNFRLFWAAGILFSLGWILLFLALSQERVSVVIPLLETQPLFILLLASVYVKELESVSARARLGLFLCISLIISGIVLISL
jgi:uncharacterized membrane protein